MPQSYVLDTSVILNLIRGQNLGKAIDQAFGLRIALHRHVVSIVSHGELKVLASRNRWGNKKLDALVTALQELVTVNVDANALVDAYVQVEEACRQVASGERVLGQNDLWIAATALYTGLPLITTDKDFNHLNGQLMKVYWVDPKSVKETIQ